MPENLQETLCLHSLWLKNQGGTRTDLSGADLRDADLRDADLRRVDLRNADLRDADLRDADLSGANLRDADLSGANLRDADLRDANLRRVDLSGADLRDADLRDVEIPKIPHIDARILDAIEGGGTLEMNNWHTCGTSHCRAGWVITLVGEPGAKLEALLGPAAAGALIYAASRPEQRIPDFYSSNDDTMSDIRAGAAADPLPTE